MKTKKQYGEIIHKIDWEGGLGEYILSYESPETFDDDKELQILFITCYHAAHAFERLLIQRYTDLGGDLDEL